MLELTPRVIAVNIVTLRKMNQESRNTGKESESRLLCWAPARESLRSWAFSVSDYQLSTLSFSTLSDDIFRDVSFPVPDGFAKAQTGFFQDPHGSNVLRHHQANDLFEREIGEPETN